MTTLEIVLIALALVLAAYGALRVIALRGEVQRLSFATDSLQGSLRSLREELGRELLATRGHLARVSAGERLDRLMILDGRPFADLGAEDAQKLLSEDGRVFLLDVRTPGEYERGHIPGSKLVPVDTLERRLAELPQDKGTPVVVYCQSGGRSAAACGQLSELGYTALYNLAGGIGAWRGAVEQGSPAGGARA
jgi:rhodanese-related sulfurtransferase